MKKRLDLEDILTDRVVEEDFLEVPLVDKVFKVLFYLILILAAFVLVQFGNLGLGQHSFFQKRAFNNMADIKVQPAPRGIIFDRFNKALVNNEPSFNIFLVPHELPNDAEGRRKAINEMAEILNIDSAVIFDKLSEKDWSLSEKLFLTNELSQDQLVSLSSRKINGLSIEAAFKRVHAEPFVFSHIIGYTGLVDKNDINKNPNLTIDDVIGRSGLENYYDSYLRGVNGEEISFRNAKGELQEERQSRLPGGGRDIKTFIDADLQEYFYERLKESLNSLGRNIGIGLAFNPQNGEVLALVGIPGFDSLKVSQFLDEATKPFFNRAVSGLYNPGSTIKPLVALGALVDGVIDAKKQIFSAGFIEIPNPYNPDNPSRFVDWKPHGWVDVYSALARSSNVYFYEVGGGFKDQKGLGILGLKKWWQRFGLDKKTSIDLPGEEIGFLPDPVWKESVKKDPWRLGDTYNVSIGQGDLLVTPVELLNYISTIANGGKIYKLRIVKSILDDKNKIDETWNRPIIISDLGNILGDKLQEVQRGMREGVTKAYGTSYFLHDLPISVAAKTGTAQVENNAKTNAFFVGYAPYENPEIAILVLIENSREGSLNTVPVAYDIFLWYYNNRLKSKTK
ncbi:MAG: penicillin-binding transpeptidase domain-containing protein [Patescibacteria group bacterium]|nr:penicillin-binding transpeptidase domain-containing protein [Patescibacteria group bacterium]